MTAFLRLILRRGATWLGSPSRLATGLAMLAALTASYRAGSAHEYRAGFDAGRAACQAAGRAATGEAITRQMRDRLNAENDARARRSDADGLRCGPATRDCPD